MTDIPYADYFTVDSRIEAHEKSEGSTTMYIGVAVRFTKQTWFHNQISKQSIQEMKESTQIFLKVAHRFADTPKRPERGPGSLEPQGSTVIHRPASICGKVPDEFRDAVCEVLGYNPGQSARQSSQNVDESAAKCVLAYS